jgi:hypothetical protein
MEEAVMVYLRYQSGIYLEELRNPQKINQAVDLWV